MNGPHLRGYAATFHHPDAQADQIDPGAFRHSLRRRGHRLPLLWQHAMAEPIGHILDAGEDHRGLWFRATLADTRRAADALALIRRGSLRECSIGFLPQRVRFEQQAGHPIRRIQTLDLIEISLVTLAANPAARLTSIDGRPLDPTPATARAPAALRRRLALALPLPP